MPFVWSMHRAGGRRSGSVGGVGRSAADPAALGERVRAAEVIGALSLATDVGIGMSLGYGLQSTLVAMRLAGPRVIAKLVEGWRSACQLCVCSICSRVICPT